MKMAIIYGEVSTTHQLLIERAENLFDSVLAAPVDGIKFVHGEEGNKVLYKGTDLTEFDAAYLRIGDQDQFFAEHLTEILNQEDVITAAESDTFAYESNKFYSMKILSENNINVPESAYTLSPSVAVDSAEELGYPIIMKTIGGGGGEGVMRATSESELKPVMDTMKTFEQDICLQEYMEHAGSDNRVIVIGDQVWAYSRSSSDDSEWRSNISSGGERKKTEVTEEMAEVAKRAAQASGFDICGIDVIENGDELYVLEINGAFGINEDINEMVGEDIILRIAERLHEEALNRDNS